MKPETNTIYCGDALVVMKDWPAGCVDCVITSIPYWGLRSYSWGGDKACKHKWADLDETYQGCTCGARRPRYGIEPTLEEYLAKTVEIFREVRRVLKPWGTLWLNCGDVYAGSWGNYGRRTGSQRPQTTEKYQRPGAPEENWRPPTSNPEATGLAPGNLLMLPARVALALQAEGWVLRSEIIWVKAWSFHDCNGRHITETGTDLFGDPYEDVVVDEPDYVGSTMPESVNGWRWSRHRVKIKAGSVNRVGYEQTASGEFGWPHLNPAGWQDCPGCDKCSPNGGLVLRKGNWRPTKAHEQMFLLSKPSGYYCDSYAVREEGNIEWRSKTFERDGTGQTKNEQVGMQRRGTDSYHNPQPQSGRNLRDCWCINPQPFGGAHFATFPEKLVEPCIKAGTSEKGNCPKCGMPWVRVLDIGNRVPDAPGYKQRGAKKAAAEIRNTMGPTEQQGTPNFHYETTTLGWRPSCNCNAGEPVPAVVLDAFMGSGTVGLVAERLGRNWLGIEINPEYVAMAEKRLSKDKTLLEK